LLSITLTRTLDNIEYYNQFLPASQVLSFWVDHHKAWRKLL